MCWSSTSSCPGRCSLARPPMIQRRIEGRQERQAHTPCEERPMSTQTAPTGTGAYADVNGINLYYETHGTGRPLVLLHGGLMHGGLFAPVIDLYAANHQVITVDLQGH